MWCRAEQTTLVDAVVRADGRVYRRIARSDSPVLDRAMPALSRAADFSLLWLGVAAGLHGFGGERGKKAAMRGVVSIGITSLVTNQVLKRVRWRDRPDASRLPLRRVARRMPTSSSFPSGHAASAAAFATSVAVEHPAAGVAVGALAGAVGLSRVATGAHYPSDVLTGFAVGAGIAGLGAKLVPSDQPLINGPRRGEAVEVPALPEGAGLVVLGNSGSGIELRNDHLSTIEKALPKARVLRFEPGDDLVAIAEEAAAGASALGACGGDGTIVALAEVAMRHGLPLAVFPGGTFNNFSRTAGIESMDDALDAVRSTAGTRVDVGTLNDAIFLNTASIGSYPGFVAERERLQPRFGKRIAAAIAGWRLFTAAPTVDLIIDGERLTAALFFVGNGQYVPLDFAPLFRPDLADGTLDIRVLDAGARGKRPRMAWASLTGAVERSSMYRRWTASDFEVSIVGPEAPIARDGELDSPAGRVRFGVLPQALTIYQPPAAGR